MRYVCWSCELIPDSKYEDDKDNHRVAKFSGAPFENYYVHSTAPDHGYLITCPLSLQEVLFEALNVHNLNAFIRRKNLFDWKSAGIV